MTKTPPRQITSWSYSRYQTYEDCPAKAKYKFIDKLPEPPAPAMERGTAIHKMAEDYLEGKTRNIPPELKNYADWFKELKPFKPRVEEELAFTSEWRVTGWFDRDAWCRVKVDAAAKIDTTMYIIDHKTGKINSDHQHQLSLYALAGFTRYANITHVVTQLWYLDHQVDPTEKTYEAAELPGLKKEWESNTKAMLADTKFAPRPGRACTFCAFSKKKGGPCKF